MVRVAILASMILLASPGLLAAAPIGPDNFLWRFSGTVTDISENTGSDVFYAPFLQVGDSIEGTIGVKLPAGSGPGPVSLTSFEVDMNGGYFEAGFDTMPGFDPHSPAHPPVPFDFSGVYDGFLEFDGATGALFGIGGYMDAGYRGGEYAQFRWGLDGGVIQQIANDRGQSTPSHFFTYEWSYELVEARAVPEPSTLALLGTALLLGGIGLARAGRPATSAQRS